MPLSVICLHSYLLLLSILLTVQVPLLASAEAASSVTVESSYLPPEIEKLPAEMRRLPVGIQAWYVYETFYLSRVVNAGKLASPKLGNQDPYYKPEARNVFDLTGIWINAEDLTVYRSKAFNGFLQQSFERQRDGKKQYLLLIHPESIDLYAELLQKYDEKETFRAVATASSRSLLAWRPGQEEDAFIAKVSLAKMVGGSQREIKGREAARSVGISQTLEGTENLPTSAIFMLEPFSLIPKGMEIGAMILRRFPKEFFEKDTQFLPLFALYGDELKGPLLRLIQNSSLPVRETVKEQFLRPFAKMWAAVLAEQKLLNEPHAQNVLMEMKNGELTGRFALRDFGGFNFNFEARRKAGLFVPKTLPTFSGDRHADYFSEIFDHYIPLSLTSYFESGVLYPLELNLSLWARDGLIPQTEGGYYHLREAFLEALSDTLSARLGRQVQVSGMYENLREIAQELVNPKALKNRLKRCVEFLRQ